MIATEMADARGPVVRMAVALLLLPAMASVRPARIPLQAGIALSLGVIGAALHLASPTAAVAVTLVGLFLAYGGAMTLNTGAMRALLAVTSLLHGSAVYFASESLVAAAAATTATLSLAPPEGGIRRKGFASGFVTTVPLGVSLALLALAVLQRANVMPALPAILLGDLSVVAVLVFLVDLRRLNRPSTKVAVGEPVPDFSARARDGSTFRLSNERGRSVLLCFLRGDWCPVCQVMMRIYKKESTRLAEHGVKLVIISSSAGPEAMEFARVFGLDYTILEDPECAVAALFDVVHPGGFHGADIPLPTSFLIDREGKLLFATGADAVGEFLDPARAIDMISKPSGPGSVALAR